jgi:thiol-disulfide isomerase/thioredoxin
MTAGTGQDRTQPPRIHDPGGGLPARCRGVRADPASSPIVLVIALAMMLVIAGCGSATSSGGPAVAVHGTAVPSGPSRPDWFGLEMTDVRTGSPFTIDDFAGKVVLLETMAVWCPTCRKQEHEVVRLHTLLGDPPDLVSISLDTDMEEDAALLKDYAETLGYDWYIALAPLLVARALGNLYSAEYLNPPASPMLVIDRAGGVMGLPYGLKSAEGLQGVVSPLLGS